MQLESNRNFNMRDVLFFSSNIEMGNLMRPMRCANRIERKIKGNRKFYLANACSRKISVMQSPKRNYVGAYKSCIGAWVCVGGCERRVALRTDEWAHTHKYVYVGARAFAHPLVCSRKCWWSFTPLTYSVPRELRPPTSWRGGWESRERQRDRERGRGGEKGENAACERGSKTMRGDERELSKEDRKWREGSEERREFGVCLGLGLRNDACTTTIQVRDGSRRLRASCESQDGARRRNGRGE